jgi:hypothetical protein
LAVVNVIVGFCGIVCSDCPVFKATLENNDEERNRVAELFTEQYGKEYKPADINCEGCVSDSERIFGFCGVCGIRRCGRERRVKNCGYCVAYPCEKLDEVFNAFPKAKRTLDETYAIRKREQRK